MSESTNESMILGIDIGGTGIKASAVDIETGTLKEKHLKVPTPQPSTPTAMLSTIKEMISELNWNGNIGSGFPGVIKNGQVFTAANLSKEWIGVNLEDGLQECTSDEVADVAVVNDADAAGLAEMKFGAGAEYYNHRGGVILIVTLGTGIGSALFVDGHLVHNTEFGRNGSAPVDVVRGRLDSVVPARAIDC